MANFIDNLKDRISKLPFRYQYVAAPDSDNYWQCCPICGGVGIVQTQYQDMVKCSVCNGKKIISTLTGLPPQDANNNAEKPETRQFDMSAFYPYTPQDNAEKTDKS